MAGDDWLPLKLELEIQPGSALDFSALNVHDAPAGKHGWLQANANGTSASMRDPMCRSGSTG